MLSNDGTHSDSTCMNLLTAVPVTMIPAGFFIMGSGILVVGSWVGWDLDYYTICVAGSWSAWTKLIILKGRMNPGGSHPKPKIRARILGGDGGEAGGAPIQKESRTSTPPVSRKMEIEIRLLARAHAWKDLINLCLPALSACSIFRYVFLMSAFECLSSHAGMPVPTLLLK